MAKKNDKKKILLLIGVAAAAYFLFKKKPVRKSSIPTVEYLEEGFVKTDSLPTVVPVEQVNTPVFKVPERDLSVINETPVFVSETPVFVSDNTGKVIEQDVYTIDRITHIGVQPVSYAAVSGQRNRRRMSGGISSGILR